MNLKLWAVLVSVMILLTCSGLYLESQSNQNRIPKDSSAMSLISRVNNEGSGIFAEKNDLVPRVNGVLPMNSDGSIDWNADGKSLAYYQGQWNGMVMATPGPSSIQYIMLMDFVNNYLHMDFRLADTASTDNTVFWTTIAAGEMFDYWTAESKTFNGGIVWEPHYENLILNGNANPVLLTGELDEDHACCVIAVNRAYLNNNTADVIRFLAAYIEAVDWMNKAISDPTSDDYTRLVEIAMSFIYPGTDSSSSNYLSRVNVIEESFRTVLYVYDLGNIKSEVNSLVETYYEFNLLSNTLESIGFNSVTEFSNWLVNDSILSLAEDVDSSSYTDTVTIKVALLTADIHQLAIRVAMDMGFFAKYNIVVETSYQTVGGNVALLLVTGEADIGILGAPPVVLNAINTGR